MIHLLSGINAVVQSNHDKARVRSVAPPGSTVVINVNGMSIKPSFIPLDLIFFFFVKDVFQTGAVITAVSIIIFLITCGYIALITFRPTSFTRSKLISAQAYVLGFFTAWLFATLVPFTHFYRTRSARVEAMIGSFQIPDTVIQSIEQQFGLTPVYHELHYCKLSSRSLSPYSLDLFSQCVWWPFSHGLHSSSVWSPLSFCSWPPLARSPSTGSRPPFKLLLLLWTRK
jgi:hypothetical protein